MTANGKSSATARTPSRIRRRSDAFKDAVALAHLDVRSGREADVIVQCEDDMFRPEWDSTRDSYPPPLVPEH